MYPRIPEEAFPVVMTPPVTTNGGVTTDFISLKNAHMVYIVAVFTQAAAHATGIDPTQSTVVAGSDAKAITRVCPIWYNADLAANNTLTRATDAITQACANTVKNQMIIMQIDPAGFDLANGFDVLGMTVDDSSQATNFVSITAYIVPRYPGALDVDYIAD